MLTLEQLLQKQTREHVRESIYSTLEQLDLPTTSWKTGSVVRTIIDTVAIALEGVLAVQNTLVRAGFRRYVNSREWAVAIADQVYGYEARGATFAAGGLTVNNPSGWVYNDVLPGDFVVRSSSSGKSYVNTETFSIGAGGTAVVACRAMEPGSASTAAPGTIDALVTSYLGLEIFNEQAWVGQDEETIAQIWESCDEYLESFSAGGPNRAYAWAAKNARRADGSLIGINRVAVSSHVPSHVVVHIATPTGESIAESDRDRINLAVQQFAVPVGTTATVRAAGNDYILTDPSFDIYHATTTESEAEMLDKIRLALAAWLSNEPIGGRRGPWQDGRVFYDAMIQVMREAVPAIIWIRPNNFDPSIDDGWIVEEGNIPVFDGVVECMFYEVFS